MFPSTSQWWSLLATALVTPLPVMAQGTGTISGRVTHAIHGAPIANMRIELARARDGFTTTATSGLDGLFVETSLEAGYYYARTRNDLGYTDQLYHEIPCAGSCTIWAGTPIFVATGSAADEIDFALRGMACIEGTVTNEVTGASANAMPVRALSIEGTDVASASTDSYGRYSIRVPFGGPYFVVADGWSRGYVSEAFDNVPCDSACDLARAQTVTAVPDTIVSRNRFQAGTWRRHHRTCPRLDDRTADCRCDRPCHRRNGGQVAQALTGAEGHTACSGSTLERTVSGPRHRTT